MKTEPITGRASIEYFGRGYQATVTLQGKTAQAVWTGAKGQTYRRTIRLDHIVAFRPKAAPHVELRFPREGRTVELRGHRFELRYLAEGDKRFDHTRRPYALMTSPTTGQHLIRIDGRDGGKRLLAHLSGFIENQANVRAGGAA